MIRFAVIDLDCNEPVVAFDSLDEADECCIELSQQDIRCMVDTLDSNNAYRL